MARIFYRLDGAALILLIAVIGNVANAAALQAVDLPPKEVIEAAFEAPLPPAHAELKQTGKSADMLCGLMPADLNVTRGDRTRAFKVLTDADAPGETKVFLRVERMTVDADGSSRAYHPDDPLGTGICKPGKQGACAIDVLPDADIVVLRGTTKVKEKDETGYAATWAEAWALIKKNPKASLTHERDPRIPADFALYYFKAADLTVVFKTPIIPFRDGAPCMRGPTLTNPGYFVAATSFRKTLKAKNVCDPTQYLDASRVPFIVIPGDTFDNLQTGDIAVVFVERANGGGEPFFGIVGDKGPPFATAEASIALNSKILGRTKPLVNAADQGKIDIKIPNDGIKAVGILILAGSRAALNGDYSADHIAAVGGRLLKRWSPRHDSRDRLASCLMAAPVNPREE